MDQRKSAKGASALGACFGGFEGLTRRAAFRRLRDDKDRLWAGRRSQAEILGRMPVSRDQEERDDYDRQNDRFLMVTFGGYGAPREITVVQNWFQELTERVPVN